MSTASDYALPSSLSGSARLDYLLLLLQNLPPRHIPLGNQHYQFSRYSVNDDDVELTGSTQGALNRALELAFGNRVQGPVQFAERGPGLEAVVEVLQKYITGDDGENILLWKWVEDLSLASCAAYKAAGKQLPSLKRQSKRTSRAMASSGGDSDEETAAPKGPILKRARHTAVPDEDDDDGASLHETDASEPPTELAASDTESEPAIDDISSDTDEDAVEARPRIVKKASATQKQGGNALLLLRDAGKSKPKSRTAKAVAGSAQASKASKGKKAALAVASKQITAQSWNWPPNDLRDDPLPARTGGVGHPRDLLAHELAIRCYTKSTNALRFRCSQPGCCQSWSKHLQPQRVINHAINECKGISSELKELARKQSAQSAPSAKAEALGSIESDGDGESTAASRTDGSLLAMARAGGREALQIRADEKLVTLICDAGLAYKILDRDSWKEWVLTLNRGVNTVSASTFANNFLVAEAARAVDKSLERLKTLNNLTISYDGGTNRLVQSVYTIHVTEPRTRQAHLLVGDEQSGVSHTGEHIAEQVEKVMISIGANRFVLALSDNTGSTRLAREILVKKYPTLASLPDPTHHLNNTVGDICSLSYFQKMVAALRQLIRFFRASSFAAHHLRSQRMLDGRRRGLQKNNKTRFALITRLGNSALFNLDSIKSLVDGKIILISPKERRSYSFLCNEQKFGEFRLHLRQMLAVTVPISKAIKCLESPHCNPGDTYKFWLAIMATMADLFENNDDGLGLPDSVIASIRRILNMRYKQMLEGSSGILIKAALFVDPAWIGSSLWRKKNPNPLAPASRRPAKPAASTLAANDMEDLRDTMPSFAEIGSYLGNMLKIHLQAAGAKEIARHGGAHAIRDAFQAQFAAYARQTHPFNRTSRHGALEYWKTLSPLPDANLLALVATKLLSMVGNSMCEERTMSNFTWLNTSSRGSMKVRTLVQYTQVKQHNDRRKGRVPSSKPTVLKFRELAAHVRADILGVDQEPNEWEPEPEDVQEVEDDEADADEGNEDTEEVFHLVESRDTDATLEQHGDIPDDEFSPAVTDGVDLLTIELRDLLSDVALAAEGGGELRRGAAGDRSQGIAAPSTDIDMDDVDFGFN